MAAADESRQARIHAIVSHRQEESETVSITGDIGTLRLAGADDEAVASLTLGPGAVGGFLRATANSLLRPGDSAAALACELIALGDSHWRLGIGDLWPARSIRV